ncbi:MAG: ATP-binding protein [Kiritimatiellia bacterium]|jgi:anti-sigma regulatory factor (Ser/Thr protein kinase)|nr:ATP-binding protein [Kiritimatiellia bacterium]
MPQLYGEHSWQIPNQMGPATAMTRDALKWANAFPISDQAKYSLRLALEEMLSNTVKYGYADQAIHPISISITVDSELIRIELIDDARPFNPTLQPKPDIAHNVAVGIAGGFGIELVRRICRHMGYRREQNRNHVTLHIESADLDSEVDSELAASKEMSP